MGRLVEQDGKRDTSIEVVVLDVLDQTATAKVIASWGIDLLMGKYDGKWKTVRFSGRVIAKNLVG
jgi:hypothetical protein